MRVVRNGTMSGLSPGRYRSAEMTTAYFLPARPVYSAWMVLVLLRRRLSSRAPAKPRMLQAGATSRIAAARAQPRARGQRVRAALGDGFCWGGIGAVSIRGFGRLPAGRQAAGQVAHL